MAPESSAAGKRRRTGLVIAAALATASCASTVSSKGDNPLLQRDKVVDIGLELDAAAIASLRKSADNDVPGRLVARHGGRTETAAVEVRLKGQRGSKRSVDDKPALKIKALKDGRIFGLERLTLNNMVQDETMLHEALGYHVYASAGVPVPDTGYVRLAINGTPYGLYIHVETVDRAFLRRRLGDDSGVLYEGAYGADLRAGDEKKFELQEGHDPENGALSKLIAAVAVAGDGVFYGERAAVDTLSFLSMMAVQALIADWDNYYDSNNYRIYWNPSSRRWHFIPTGLDQTFTDHPTDVFGATGLLFQKCLASERCTADYVAAVHSAADRFERLGLETTIDRLLAAIDADSRADSRKPYSTEAMESSRAALRRFIATRARFVRSRLGCMEDGRETVFAACAGAVLFYAGRDRCAEIRSRTPGEDGSRVHEEKCTGGVKQRWRIESAPRSEDPTDAVVLKSVSTGHCLEIEGGGKGRLRQMPCSGHRSQRFSRASTAGGTTVASVVDPQRGWRVERSIVK